MIVVKGMVDPLSQPGTDLGLITVTDRFDDQLLEALFLENVAEDAVIKSRWRVSLPSCSANRNRAVFSTLDPKK
jgi:hypothetical protein